jgi:hypothetical protein
MNLGRVKHSLAMSVHSLAAAWKDPEDMGPLPKVLWIIS